MSKHYIKEWRKHRGLTQAQFGERMGLSPNHVSKIEGGRVSYTQDLLERAGKVLNCTPVDLIIRAPDDVNHILEVWASLTDVQQGQVVEIAKTLKGPGK